MLAVTFHSVLLEVSFHSGLLAVGFHLVLLAVSLYSGLLAVSFYLLVRAIHTKYINIIATRTFTVSTFKY